MTQTLERFLAAAGAIACAIISIRVGQVVSEQQPMWPLPALYLIEMVVLSVIALLSILRDAALSGTITWIAVGVLCAFVVMGAWSIGFLYLPVAVIFAVTAIVMDRRQKHNSVRRLGLAGLGGVVQVAGMLIAIRLLYPDAVF